MKNKNYVKLLTFDSKKQTDINYPFFFFFKCLMSSQLMPARYRAQKLIKLLKQKLQPKRNQKLNFKHINNSQLLYF